MVFSVFSSFFFRVDIFVEKFDFVVEEVPLFRAGPRCRGKAVAQLAAALAQTGRSRLLSANRDGSIVLFYLHPYRRSPRLQHLNSAYYGISLPQCWHGSVATLNKWKRTRNEQQQNQNLKKNEENNHLACRFALRFLGQGLDAEADALTPLDILYVARLCALLS